MVPLFSFCRYKCSAKSGENIKKACRHLVSQIVKNNAEERKKAEVQALEEGAGADNSIRLDNSSGPSEKSGGCC